MNGACDRPGLVPAGFLGLGLVSAGFLDHPLEAWLAGLRAGALPWLPGPWLAAAEALPPLVAAGCAAWLLVLAARGRLRGGAAARPTAVLLSVAVPLLAALALKHAIGRGRPCCSGPLHAEPFAMLDAFASFPSAQSAMAAGLAAALAPVVPRLAVPAAVLALLIGLGRLSAGAHWASDVVMGWGLGAALGLRLARRPGRRGTPRGGPEDAPEVTCR